MRSPRMRAWMFCSVTAVTSSPAPSMALVATILALEGVLDGQDLERHAQVGGDLLGGALGLPPTSSGSACRRRA